jgi:hypothetical protein
VSPRPLAVVTGLTACDYLLWNWSLGGGHDVLALISGLTLPPLVAASALMIALTLARLISRSAARSGSRSVARGAAPQTRAARPASPSPKPATRRARSAHGPQEERSDRRIAA